MDWHYQDPRTGERRGPTSHEVMADKFRSGELDGDTLVWRDGLAAWQLAAQTADFAADARRTTTPPLATPVPAGESIAYFTPRGDMPARAQQNLHKYAAPTGPVGDWPLNDEHVAQLSQAVLLRKRILGSFNLIRLAAALNAILGAILLLMGGFAIAGMSGRRAQADAWGMLIPGIVIAGFAALGFACANATWYCRAWGSLVMAILTTVGIVLQVGTTLFAAAAVGGGSGNGGAAGMLLFANVFGVAISAAFAFVYWRGWRATAPYLDTPVWCQEALAVADRAR